VPEVDGVTMLYVSARALARSIRATRVIMLSSRRGSYPPIVGLGAGWVGYWVERTCDYESHVLKRRLVRDFGSEVGKGVHCQCGVFLLLEAI